MKTLQNPIGKCILYFGIVAALLALCMQGGIAHVLDRYTVLSNTHVSYYNLTSTWDLKYVPTFLADTGSVNLIENGATTWEYDRGFTITVHADGSVTYKGTNNAEDIAYIRITSYDWNLQDGTYVLSDGLHGEIVGGTEILLDMIGRTGQSDGSSTYLEVANAADPEKVVFETDYTTIDEYYAQLVIAPGYTSDGITFYPMLTTPEQRTTSYEPCLMTDPSVYEGGDTALTSYNYMTMSRTEYHAMTDADRALLKHCLQYQAPYYGSWTTIDLQDGTGLYYPENDPAQVQYGVLNCLGQISILYGDEVTETTNS